ncbi:MAG: hypothetical protein P4L71_05910 [Acetobacteraceae bacterium]|nr:hypothetical protein [Acetobacteraceae bacterium]
MQYWIELSVGAVAGIAVIFVAFEGVRIFVAWRRANAETADL